MSIYKKLLEIQKEVDSFVKDGQSGSGGFGYKYVSGNQALNKIRPLMNEKGVILKQEIMDIENTRMDYQTSKGAEKSEILTSVKMRFTWVDVETGETDVNEFGANGMNDWEKGLGSALTYGERYFLLKYFHVPTDEDDVDNDKRKKNNSGSYKVDDDKKWLNATTLAGETTKQWINVLQGIHSGKITSLDQVRDVYKVNKKTAELIENELKNA